MRLTPCIKSEIIGFLFLSTPLTQTVGSSSHYLAAPDFVLQTAACQLEMPSTVPRSGPFSASEVTTIWRYTNVYIIIIIIRMYGTAY